MTVACQGLGAKSVSCKKIYNDKKPQLGATLRMIILPFVAIGNGRLIERKKQMAISQNAFTLIKIRLTIIVLFQPLVNM
jgi:hypothetical protein